MATVKKIKTLEDYDTLSAGAFGSRVDAVIAGMMGNSNYPSSPVDIAVLKAGNDRFKVLVVESFDGSKKVIADKKKQRKAVTKMLNLIGRYVQLACEDDMAIFMTSGFLPASTAKVQAAALSEKIRKVEHGPNSGQIVLWLKAVFAAVS